jgi:hypothetical protein
MPSSTTQPTGVLRPRTRRRHRAILDAVRIPGDGPDPPSEALWQQIETADAGTPRLRWPERVLTARRPTRCWAGVGR